MLSREQLIAEVHAGKRPQGVWITDSGSPIEVWTFESGHTTAWTLTAARAEKVLQEQRRRELDALEFYACKDNWECGAVALDRGRMAWIALGGIPFDEAAKDQ
jgi:hypothetical protein